MGKSAFGVASAYKSALLERPSLFFSLEMGGQRLANRVAAFACYGGPVDRVPYFDIEAGALSNKQADRFANAARDLQNVPLIIEQQSGLTVARLSPAPGNTSKSSPNAG